MGLPGCRRTCEDEPAGWSSGVVLRDPERRRERITAECVHAFLREEVCEAPVFEWPKLREFTEACCARGGSLTCPAATGFDAPEIGIPIGHVVAQEPSPTASWADRRLGWNHVVT